METVTLLRTRLGSTGLLASSLLIASGCCSISMEHAELSGPDGPRRRLGSRLVEVRNLQIHVPSDDVPSKSSGLLAVRYRFEVAGRLLEEQSSWATLVEHRDDDPNRILEARIYVPPEAAGWSRLHYRLVKDNKPFVFECSDSAVLDRSTDLDANAPGPD